MSTLTSLRRTGTMLAASALAVSLVATGSAAQAAQAAPSSSPAGHGATWLAKQLNSKHLIHNNQFAFDDYGLTIDTAFALDAIGGQKADVTKAAKAIAKHIGSYTTGADFGYDEIYSGAVGKSLVLAEDTKSGPRSFGGVNLVNRMAGRVISDGPSKGRIHDKVDPADTFGGDFANTIGQVFAVRGLLKAGNDAGTPALKFLLAQQCRQGYFRLSFTADKDAADQGCAAGDQADPDVTALAVIELASVTQGHGKLGDALGAATTWLKKQQGANGGIGGAGPTAAVNANSTGLAGWAFLTAGTCGAARDAAGWLSDHQVTGDVSGTPLAGERGAIAYDNAARKAGKQDGITKKTRDQWRRATSQAAPALLALSGC